MTRQLALFTPAAEEPCLGGGGVSRLMKVGAPERANITVTVRVFSKHFSHKKAP